MNKHVYKFVVYWLFTTSGNGEIFSGTKADYKKKKKGLIKSGHKFGLKYEKQNPKWITKTNKEGVMVHASHN